MECRVTSPEKTSIANLRTKSWKTARLTARIASTALLLQSTRATAPPCTMATARAAGAAGRALRKLSGGPEAARRRVMQTCKVRFREVCHQEWITSLTEVYIKAVGLSSGNDRVGFSLSLLSKNRMLYHLFFYHCFMTEILFLWPRGPCNSLLNLSNNSLKVFSHWLTSVVSLTRQMWKRVLSKTKCRASLNLCIIIPHKTRCN